MYVSGEVSSAFSTTISFKLRSALRKKELCRFEGLKVEDVMSTFWIALIHSSISRH